MIVIKYGGSLLEEPGHRSAFLKDVAALSRKEKLMLVHGGGKEISRQMEKAGLKPAFVNGRRYTDEETMTLVEKVLNGLNGEIVAELRKNGAEARGLSGRDNHLAEGEAVKELGRVGQHLKVNAEGLKHVLSATSTPVFYSVANDADRKALNVNADDFALALAIASRADRLVFLTDTGGVLDGEGKLIAHISSADVPALAQKKIISGGMLVKVNACANALKEGVGTVDIVKGINYLLEPGKASPDGTVFTHGH